jgi:hypothetical protein
MVMKKVNCCRPSTAARLFFLFVALLGIPFPGAVAGGEEVRLEIQSIANSEVTVNFEKPLITLAATIPVIYSRIEYELEHQLGWQVSFRPTVLLIREHTTFRAIAGTDAIAAFADPHRLLMVIDCSRIGAYPFQLEATLKHELCHLLLHQRVTRDLPRWLDEGICQWVSWGMAEIFTDGRQRTLKAAALAGKLIPLRDLAGTFPQRGTDLTLAYEESKSVVDYMVKKYGEEGLLSVLARLREGESAAEAIQHAFSLSPEALETDWRRSLQTRIGWFVWVSIYLYEILFFLAGILVVLGFLRMMRRRRLRRLLQELDDEDGFSM